MHVHWSLWRYSRAILSAVFFRLCLTSAALLNVTVDDQGDDPTTTYGVSYTANDWNIGQTCKGCQAQPDASMAHGGTWHDATYDPSIASRATPQNATFDFTGELSHKQLDTYTF